MASSTVSSARMIVIIVMIISIIFVSIGGANSKLDNPTGRALYGLGTPVLFFCLVIAFSMTKLKENSKYILAFVYFIAFLFFEIGAGLGASDGASKGLFYAGLSVLLLNVFLLTIRII